MKRVCQQKTRVKAGRKLKSTYKKRNKTDSREGFAGVYMHTSCVTTVSTTPSGPASAIQIYEKGLS
jgi:hypothetical protein